MAWRAGFGDLDFDRIGHSLILATWGKRRETELEPHWGRTSTKPKTKFGPLVYLFIIILYGFV